MSRGAREGNNAFTKDQQTSLIGDASIDDADIMHWNLSLKFINGLSTLIESRVLVSSQSLIESVFEAVR